MIIRTAPPGQRRNAGAADGQGTSKTTDSATSKPTKTLDCIGLYCPEPVFRTREEISTVPMGEVLEVLADDPASESDIRSWAKHAGQELISVEKRDGGFRFLIRRKT